MAISSFVNRVCAEASETQVLDFNKDIIFVGCMAPPHVTRAFMDDMSNVLSNYRVLPSNIPKPWALCTLLQYTLS